MRDPTLQKLLAAVIIILQPSTELRRSPFDFTMYSSNRHPRMHPMQPYGVGMTDENDGSSSETNNHRANYGDVRVSPQPAPAVKSPITTADKFHHTESIWRIVVDVVSLGILLTITVISHYVAQPFLRGFFCSDMTIRYPYKDDTIPVYAAVLLSIGIPIVWMWTTEFCKLCYFKHYQKEIYRVRLELCGNASYHVKPIARNLYMLTVIFVYGYLTTWVFTEVTKNFVGRLRPHFISVCQPSFNCSSVNNLYQFNAYLEYGTDYTCLNTDSTAVREARRSFFSGHTSPLFYGLGFLIMYIHISWSWRHLGVLGHVLQAGLTILAAYVGYTRIFDYHHHWQDVTVGAIVGSLVAFATFKFILNWRYYDPDFLPHIVAKKRGLSAGSHNGSASMASDTHSGAMMMNKSEAGYPHQHSHF